MNPIPAVANVRAFTLVARADGSPITTGTVNTYIVALTGDNAGKWFQGSDQTWQAAEAVALAATHKGDGHWTASIHADCWILGVRYMEYAKESGDLHVPVNRMTIALYPDGWTSAGEVVTDSASRTASKAIGFSTFNASSDTVDLGAILGTALTETAGYIAAGFKKLFNVATPVLTVASVNQTIDNPTAATITDAIWDEALTGATHNTPTTAGRRLRELASTVIYSNTAAGGGTTYITLDAGASATDGAYDPAVVSIIGGTGIGQSRLIMEYTGATRRAYVDRDWKVTPDNTSEFVINAHPGRETTNEGILTSATDNTAVLNAFASAEDNVYAGYFLFIRAGTGQDQVAVVSHYNGGTKTVTLEQDWEVNPAAGSVYSLLPNHHHTNTEAQALAEAAIDAKFTFAGTDVQATLDGELVTLANGAHGGAAATLVLSDYASFKVTGFSTHSAADVYTAFGTGANLTSLASAANLAIVDGIVDNILIDTNELQTEWADGGRLDLILDTAAAGGGLTAADVWGYATRTLTAFGFTVVTDAASRTASKADVSALATAEVLTAVKDILEANWVVDKTDPTQYKLIVTHKTTGATLLTKNLSDIDGDPITSDTTPIAGQEEAT